MESQSEREFLEKGAGTLYESYIAMGITGEMISSRINSHSEALGSYLSPKGNLILVHNTFVSDEDISGAMARGKTFWCLCPSSNLYIENSLPPVDLLKKANATIVIGTDSLASNDSLSVINELKILQSHFPSLTLQELVTWTSTNGAKAINMENELGMIKPGMKPGLVLIENIDLQNLKLTDKSSSRKLI
jgi:cytosine/adenosine deaminase-related metal-dependent hydrolase